MKVPDRWMDYKSTGDPVKGTPFICFKTPLMDGFNYHPRGNPDGLLPEHQFSPKILLREVQKQGHRLALIIDLTNTLRYYNGFKEFQRYGVSYQKIKCEGHAVPSDSVFQQFAESVSRYVNQRSPSLIGVHCTHGVNRTGYLVCRYMVECLGFSPRDAIAAFDEARGHKLERENYVTDLLKRQPKSRDIGQPYAKLEFSHGSSPYSSNSYRNGVKERQNWPTYSTQHQWDVRGRTSDQSYNSQSLRWPCRRRFDYQDELVRGYDYREPACYSNGAFRQDYHTYHYDSRVASFDSQQKYEDEQERSNDFSNRLKIYAHKGRGLGFSRRESANKDYYSAQQRRHEKKNMHY